MPLPAKVKGAIQIDGQNPTPFLTGRISRFVIGQHAGIVNQNGNLTEILPYRCTGIRYFMRITDI